MKRLHLGTVFCLLAALGFFGLIGVLVSEVGTFHDAVLDWAKRDLRAQTARAAGEIDEDIAAEDYRKIHAFGDKCAAEGVRVTILSLRGGIKFDSESGAAKGGPGARPEVDAAIRDGESVVLRTSATTGGNTLFCARRVGDSVVRLGIPAERVFAPVHRSHVGLVIAGLVGASGLLMVFLLVVRLLGQVRANERQLAALRRAEEFRREFVANVTHEIKTPLTGILGAVDLLDCGQPVSDADRATLLGLLRREATRLNDLAQDILSLGRLEHAEGGPHRDFAPADLADLAASVCDRFQTKARRANVALTVAASAPCVAVCNARLVEQALSNLVENALRYSGSPTVEIAVTRTGDYAELSVEDHGAGIAPEHQARLFERFYRVDKDRSRELGGTGLGLAIVKHVAHLHGGDVSLVSAPGRGSRFAFSISVGEFNQTEKEERT